MQNKDERSKGWKQKEASKVDNIPLPKSGRKPFYGKGKHYIDGLGIVKLKAENYANKICFAKRNQTFNSLF